jgi:hypothetical protein
MGSPADRVSTEDSSLCSPLRMRCSRTAGLEDFTLASRPSSSSSRFPAAAFEAAGCRCRSALPHSVLPAHGRRCSCRWTHSVLRLWAAPLLAALRAAPALPAAASPAMQITVTHGHNIPAKAHRLTSSTGHQQVRGVVALLAVTSSEYRCTPRGFSVAGRRRRCR